MNKPALSHILPRPLRKLGQAAIETTLNRIVRLDPDTRSSLATLEGRQVDLHLDGPDWRLRLRIEEGRIKLSDAAPETEGTLSIAGTPGSLLAMALRSGESADEQTSAGRVKISGDAELARRLGRLLRAYAPDVEKAFADTFGEVLGVPLARAFRHGFAHLRESGQHLAEDGSDWFREESRLGVPRGEMDNFLDAVDALREDLERLGRRIDQLAPQTQQPPEQGTPPT